MQVDARRRLGTSDVHVTALGLGGAALGNLYAPVAETAARATVDRAWALGVGYFDTAPYYGYGLSEERLGRALGSRERHAAVVSTKVGRLLVPRPGGAREDQGFIDAHPFDPVFDYSYDGVMRSFESSLERLGRDRIDILLMHDIGALTHGAVHHPDLFESAIRDGYRAMKRLRDEGAVGAIGLGVNECEVCVEALDRVELDCLLLAGRYTLLEQGALDRLLPMCESSETSLIVGGPFNSGVLVEGQSDTRDLDREGQSDTHDLDREGQGEPRHYDYAAAPPEVLERVEGLRRVCGEHDVPLAAAALQFPLLHPAVACVIPGARNAHEVEAQAGWFECDVPAALYRDLQAAGLLDVRAPIEGPA